MTISLHRACVGTERERERDIYIYVIYIYIHTYIYIYIYIHSLVPPIPKCMREPSGPATNFSHPAPVPKIPASRYAGAILGTCIIRRWMIFAVSGIGSLACVEGSSLPICSSTRGASF